MAIESPVGGYKALPQRNPGFLQLNNLTSMPSTFTYEWDTPKYKGKTSFNTGLFIGGQFVDGSDGTTIK